MKPRGCDAAPKGAGQSSRQKPTRPLREFNMSAVCCDFYHIYPGNDDHSTHLTAAAYVSTHVKEQTEFQTFLLPTDNVTDPDSGVHPITKAHVLV